MLFQLPAHFFAFIPSKWACLLENKIVLHFPLALLFSLQVSLKIIPMTSEKFACLCGPQGSGGYFDFFQAP